MHVDQDVQQSDAGENDQMECEYELPRIEHQFRAGHAGENPRQSQRHYEERVTGHFALEFLEAPLHLQTILRERLELTKLVPHFDDVRVEKRSASHNEKAQRDLSGGERIENDRGQCERQNGEVENELAGLAEGQQQEHNWRQIMPNLPNVRRRGGGIERRLTQ